MTTISIEIISIGDEILIGDITNTNAAWMGRELLKIGLMVDKVTTIGDEYLKIKTAVNDALSRADVVLVTGGLGPTSDDKTKKVLAEVFASDMKFFPEQMGKIRQKYNRIHKAVPSLVEDQAWYPVECRIIQNEIGTANGMVFTQDEKTLYALPGVPMEMEDMMRRTVLPELASRSKGEIRVEYIRTFGLLESEISERLADIEKQYPGIKVAYLPKSQGVDLRLTSICKTDGESDSADISEVKNKIKMVLGDNVYSAAGESLEKVIGDQMRRRRQTLSVAESCTGGLIAHKITNIPGSSDYFILGAVTYSNSAKETLLRVPREDLLKYGAVSKEVANAMCIGVKKLSGSQWGLATTGIAGPGGGSKDKPVGLVWIGCSGPGKTIIEKHIFTGDRDFNKQRFAHAALDLLRRMLYD